MFVIFISCLVSWGESSVYFRVVSALLLRQNSYDYSTQMSCDLQFIHFCWIQKQFLSLSNSRDFSLLLLGGSFSSLNSPYIHALITVENSSDGPFFICLEFSLCSTLSSPVIRFIIPNSFGLHRGPTLSPHPRNTDWLHLGFPSLHMTQQLSTGITL